MILRALTAALLLNGCAPAPSTDGQMQAYELSLAVSPTRSFAAWHGGSGKGSAIYVQAIGPDAAFVGTPMRVSHGKALAYEPDLVLAGKNPVVAWYEKDTKTGRLAAHVAVLKPDGALLWRRALGNGSHPSRNPVVRMIGDAIHVAWIEQAPATGNKAQIWHQAFTLAGEAATAARQIGEANRDSWNLNAATSGQSLILVYDAALGTKAHELHMLVMADGAIRRIRLSPDDGHASLYPDLQIDDVGRAALTWFDEKDGNREVYLLTAPLNVLERGEIPIARRITRDKGESIGAYVAWNGSTIGLAWSDQPGGQRNLYVQFFDAAGRPEGPIRKLEDSRGRASVPAIRASGRGFLIAWNDYIATGDDSHGTLTASEARLRWLPVGAQVAR